MIRIRLPNHTLIDALAPGKGQSAHVTDDDRIVALESEKNTFRTRAAVDQLLRPAVEAIWSLSRPLFSIVSVETRAGCNYDCGFCPVGKAIDPRPPGELSLSLLEKISEELAELGFAGRVSLFGNNEPLLDERMPEIVAMFRERLPDADLRILTNGTRAGLALVHELFDRGLSTLIINNYTDGTRLIAPVRRLIEAAEEFTSHDIRISVRKRDEILTTRAGLAPNKPAPEFTPRGFCALPFTDLHVTYTGDVGLCCFDAHGRVTIGNVADASLVEIWQSPLFEPYREGLMRSTRSGLTPCETCDFDGFRELEANSGPTVSRLDLLEVNNR